MGQEKQVQERVRLFGGGQEGNIPPPHVSTSRSPPCETGQGQRETQEVGKCSYPLPKGLDKFKKFTL